MITISSKLGPIGFLFLFFWAVTSWAEDCPPAVNCCTPCGQSIVTSPLPAPEACAVQPYQNYLATYECCISRAVNTFYVGTGFGFGHIDLDFNIPGINLPASNSKAAGQNYITEYVTLGYIYSRSRFFIGVELGYYYNSVLKPFFYNDPSVIVVTPRPSLLLPEPLQTVVTPCTVSVDFNARNRGAVDLLPGFALAPCFTIFGRAGVDISGFSLVRRMCFPRVINHQDILANEVILVDVTRPLFNCCGELHDEQTSTVTAFRLGAGASFVVNRYVSFTANFIHTFGGRARFAPRTALLDAAIPVIIDASGSVVQGVLSVPTANGIVTDLSTLTARNTISPTRNEVLIGVMFTFNF
jgi:hypothetical protein